jgi:hypothetical protein
MLEPSEMSSRIADLAVTRYLSWRHILFGPRSRQEVVLLAIWDLYSEVHNGGLPQYFSNSSGRRAPVIAEILNEIGASILVPIVEEAIEAVGADISWHDDSERHRIILGLSQEAKDRLGDLGRQFGAHIELLPELLYYYLLRHRKKFKAPKSFWEGATIQ